ncbi:type VI secretion system baseplate subunit TssG [Neisseriaceae bacterium PsAf]|nr:type VI secretion system baseplate subunit TssG [Neisseriaceae bacterium PsAf]MCV2503837.1 type VI secretion system baseplate subunit TssG [Neisseriaceae bacterium]
MYIRSVKSKLSVLDDYIEIIPNISVNQDFFELVRRVDKVWEPYLRLGQSRDKYFLKIRIEQPADMSFATKEVAGLRQIVKKKGQPPLVVIESRHFGLFAPYGPMPLFVTEHARSEYILNKNRAFEKFMNVISQRFALYQYCSWSQLNVAVGHDKPQSNAFQKKMDQVTGVVDGNFKYDTHIKKVRRSFPGAYVGGKISLNQLKRIISHYFNVSVNVVKRYPTWIAHKNNAEFVLGKKLLGSRFYSVEYSALLELGPFYDESYLDYDRGEDKLKILIAVCKDFVKYLLDFDVILCIETNPASRKGLKDMKMGKNSWLKPKKQMMKKVVYSPSENNKLN